MSAPYDISRVEYLGGFRLRIEFVDGLVREVDLADKIAAAVGPVFEPLKDPAFFAQVFVDHGTVAWPNGLDLDPLVLHGDFAPAASTQRVI